ncbi:MAG: MnmC family methyltransferase, partial [Symbiobacteriaceae bacterium]|nr:MnmC family methyltransferase [Symbiobacteriaceae bacterium]
KYIPSTSHALQNNPRLDLRFCDAIEYIKQVKEEFDVIIVDSSDPIDIAEGLFTREFYHNVHKALKPGGMVSIQGESPWIHRQLVKRIVSDLESVFSISTFYWSNIPTYPSGTMVFPIGSKGNDPRVPIRPAVPGLRYYSADVHRASFALPWHLQIEQMESGPAIYHWN